MTVPSQTAKEEGEGEETTQSKRGGPEEQGKPAKDVEMENTEEKSEHTTKANLKSSKLPSGNEAEVEAWELARETETDTQATDTTEDYGENDASLNEACGKMDWTNLGAPANNTGWKKVHNKKREATIYNAEENDTRVQETTRDVLKKRGEHAVEANTDKDTPVHVEFKVTKTTKSFNLREALGKLLTIMMEVDTTVKIQSNDGANTWNDPNELPVGDDMKEYFLIRQDAPPYGSPKISIYFTVKSTMKVNDIKYDEHVITYLKNFNIFMRADRYETSKVRSPGYFVKIAPRLVWEKNFVKELQTQVATTKFDTEHPIFEDYYRDNDIPNTTTTPPLPDFHVHVTKKEIWNCECRSTHSNMC